MSISTRLTNAACLGLVVLIASTSMSSAFGPKATIDGPKIELPKPPIDGPKIDVPKPHIDGPIIDVTPDVQGDDETDSGALLLSCVVDGDDLLITNKGDPIPAGAKVKWAANGKQGAIQLPNGLRPGQKAKIENVLDGGTGNCSAEIVL